MDGRDAGRSISRLGNKKSKPEIEIRRRGAKKLWGRSSRPLCHCLLQLVSASCCFFSLLSFWLPCIYSPFPFFMEFSNGVLLQLIDV
jgi:hypothetical protein